MAAIVGSRCVLAVCDLKVSTGYYTEVLGFSRDPINAEGWSFLSRDAFRLMLGECPDETPACELGNHSYFAYWNVDDVDGRITDSNFLFTNRAGRVLRGQEEAVDRHGERHERPRIRARRGQHQRRSVATAANTA